MTGVEAVSNGVRAFREPTVRTAQRTLTVIIGLLIVMLGGIAFLVRTYHIAATVPGQAGYQSVLSMLVAAVAGRGVFYYIAIGAILLVLALSANTAFADFPRLCRAIAQNRYLPDGFSIRGRRLVYSRGVYALAALAGVLLILFRGVTDRLIPLYAVGAFLAFTLSQAGMVSHWRRVKGRGAGRSIFVNGLGASATGVTTIVVLTAKFTEGAWVTVLLIPGLLALMISVRHHLDRVAKELESSAPLDITSLQPPIVVLPLQTWGKVAQKALRFGLTISSDIEVVHVLSEGENAQLQQDWNKFVELPVKQGGLTSPKLVTLQSPYRFVITPIVDYVLEIEQRNPNRQVAVLIPEMVESHWYHYFLHNNRAEALRALLLLKGDHRIVVVNIPTYLAS